MIRIVFYKDAEPVLRRRNVRLDKAEQTVRPILAAVRTEGDTALMKYAQQLDQLAEESVRIAEAELERAAARLSPEMRDALEAQASISASLRRHNYLKNISGISVTVESWARL